LAGPGRDDRADIGTCGPSTAVSGRSASASTPSTHGAHGYLLPASSPISNKRTDGYGAARERMRFPLEIARAVRARWCRKGTPLGARITGQRLGRGRLTRMTRSSSPRSKPRPDHVCISSGGITRYAPTAVANMNVQFAEGVKAEAGIATGRADHHPAGRDDRLPKAKVDGALAR
jgi:2,4-dienoyl-CoA reductase-like NADH-dependent reductase (Old Yellow Enzyme family)